MSDITYDGNNSPETVGGIAFRTWIAIQSRTQTERGKDYLNPNYGLDTYDLIDKDERALYSNLDIKRTLEGVPDVLGFRIDVDKITGNIHIEVRGG